MQALNGPRERVSLYTCIVISLFIIAAGWPPSTVASAGLGAGLKENETSANRPAPNPAGLFGGIVDISGDGHADIITPVTPDPDSGLPRIAVYSPLSSSLHFLLYGEQPGDLFGVVIRPAGDVNADGREDLLITTLRWCHATEQATTFVDVVCGFSGDSIHRLDSGMVSDGFGMSMAAVGDINNDGFDDILIGAPGYGEYGSAFLFSGQTGQVIAALPGSDDSLGFGISVAALGDVGRTGRQWYAVSAPGAAGQDSGRVYIYRATETIPVRVIEQPAEGMLFGASLAAMQLEAKVIGIGAPSTVGANGRVYVYCLNTVEPLEVIMPPGNVNNVMSFGGSVHYFKSSDGNSFEDFLAIGMSSDELGVDGGFSPLFSKYAYSQGNLLHAGVYTPDGFQVELGSSPAATPDINSDGVVDAADLAILLANYGTASPVSDLTQSGVVGVEDLAVLLAHYGQQNSRDITSFGVFNDPCADTLFFGAAGYAIGWLGCGIFCVYGGPIGWLFCPVCFAYLNTWYAGAATAAAGAVCLHELIIGY
ncbi:MAG: hypothetical protein EA376_14455 [Phycisphaeraceae bacterium]|nr:MAG: hypothetical protein EA376_14455 [Phycisphaeraceae bacterium]